MIYGITGKKGHGKDTLAQAIMAQDSSYQTMHFASLLKTMCQDIFNLRSAQIHDPKVKEEVIQPVVMDEYLPAMIAITGLDLQRQNKVAYTPREIMQYFGTDYVRAAQNDYWVSRTLKSAKKRGGNVLLPDTRFLNEYEAVKAAGGKIIKVVRLGGPLSDVGAGHISETEMDQFVPDYTFRISNGDLDEFDSIAKQLMNE